ncbi:MAG: hypothetical protein OSB47_15385 [Pirellulaceae bacterium]|nr:hypothetical protein [Pirellulaceae bacterium]
MLYRLYGAGDRVDCVVSVGGHAYREDIRKATFRFLNIHLKQDARPILDSEVDLVIGNGKDRKHPIAPEHLRVFSTDQDIPGDERNTTIDQTFVPLAQVPLPGSRDRFTAWKKQLVTELQRVSFGYLPGKIAAATVKQTRDRLRSLETEPGITITSRQHLVAATNTSQPKRLVLLIRTKDGSTMVPDWLTPQLQPGDQLYDCQTRGTGNTRWTQKNPPNYVERSHVLLGHTVDAGRVRDVIATARYFHSQFKGQVPIHLAGEGAGAVIAAYATLLDPGINGATLHRPHRSHMEPGAPQFLNVLRVCDIPHVLGMIAPRSLTITGVRAKNLADVSKIFQTAGAMDQLKLMDPE